MAKLTLYHAQLKSELKQQTLSARREIARDLIEDARAMAPILTGEYRGEMTVEENGLQIAAVDNDETAIHKEYGTSDTPAHAAMTTAAMRYGKYRGMRPKRGR